MQKSAYARGLRRQARILHALAHPERLATVEKLRDRALCVCHLTVALKRPQAYVSQQLAILKDAGIIESQQDGAFVYYRLRDRRVLEIAKSARRLAGGPPVARWRTRGALEGCPCPQCRAVAAKGGPP